MNRLFNIIILALLLLVGCQNDPTSDISFENSSNTLSIGLPDTRLAFGEKSNNNYPLYWSDVDYIYANGVKSKSISISREDPSRALFQFSGSLEYPIRLNYEFYHTELPTSNPFRKGLASESLSYFEKDQYEWGEEHKFVRPNMYAYIDKPKEVIEMKHLAGVLRFAIRAKEGTDKIDRIEISSRSNSALSGMFIINEFASPNYKLSEGLITPYDAISNGSSKYNFNSTTLFCDANYPLTTTEDRIYYVAIPEGEHGICDINFYADGNRVMHCTWDSKVVRPGIIREFNTVVFDPLVQEESLIENMGVDKDEIYVNHPNIFGYVRDNSGNPIKNVAVSDGFSVVTTDERGYYSMVPSKDCWYIFISLPSEYEVPINEYGQPCFYKRFNPNNPQYSFTLTPLPNGKENKFALFTFGDPQVSTNSKLSRFTKEAVPGIKAHATELSKTIPCYGITLGDIISNSNSTNTGAYRDDMRDGFAKSSVGLPVFQVMGNHDNTFFNSSQPIYSDEQNSTFELKAQREHESMFGPVNYSFNRGDVHIVGMRDIVYTVNTSASDYQPGFLKSQYEWLKQDLAVVPKDKVVVVCVHIPFYNRTSNYIQDVLKLLNSYKEAHIMSGHTHIVDLRYDHKVYGTGYNNVYEHNVGALCGAWWSSNMCGDGAPCGYGVFIGEGNTFSDWYYTGFHNGMNTREHQMRLYRGNAVTGGAISGSNSNGTKGYYAFNFADDVLLANIYFADTKWKISVYEDNVYSGDMTLVPYTARPLLSKMTGSGTFTDPFTPKTSTSADIYYTGLFLGILGKAEDSTGSRQACYHLYQYKLKNKNATIKVVATDCFGNKYTETKITEGTDYSLTKNP